MNRVVIQFYNRNVFEPDGLERHQLRPPNFGPKVRLEVLEWLKANVGEEDHTPGIPSSTTTWFTASLQRMFPNPRRTGKLSDKMYSEVSHFYFADPAKALLFKLTFG